MRRLNASDKDEAFGLPPTFPFQGAELSPWTIDYLPGGNPVSLPRGRLVWKDLSGSLAFSVIREQPRQFRLDFLGLLSADIRPDQKTISVRALTSDVSRNTVEHFLYNQVAPRLIADAGTLVLHAATVARGGTVLGLIGPSGVGKSTLSAGLQTVGWRLLGDDTMMVRSDGDVYLGAPVYGSLRLLPDSIEALLPADREYNDVAQYSNKKELNLLAEAKECDVSGPISALFFVSEAVTGDLVELVARKPAEVCMSLVENSFCLDPTDVSQAKDRLTTAAGLGNAVPGYSLTYPRRYEVLPRVCEAIGAKVMHIRNERSGRSQHA